MNEYKNVKKIVAWSDWTSDIGDAYRKNEESYLTYKESFVEHGNKGQDALTHFEEKAKYFRLRNILLGVIEKYEERFTEEEAMAILKEVSLEANKVFLERMKEFSFFYNSYTPEQLPH